jgi:hypothetical protein
MTDVRIIYVVLSYLCFTDSGNWDCNSGKRALPSERAWCRVVHLLQHNSSFLASSPVWGLHILTSGEQVFTQCRASCPRRSASTLCGTFGQSRLLSHDESDDGPNNEGTASGLVRWLNSAPNMTTCIRQPRQQQGSLHTFCFLPGQSGHSWWSVVTGSLLWLQIRPPWHFLFWHSVMIIQKLGTAKTLCL